VTASIASHTNPPSRLSEKGAGLNYEDKELGNEDEIEEGGGYGDPFFGEENGLYSSGRLL
jgi:hypothetical protein